MLSLPLAFLLTGAAFAGPDLAALDATAVRLTESLETFGSTAAPVALYAAPFTPLDSHDAVSAAVLHDALIRRLLAGGRFRVVPQEPAELILNGAVGPLRGRPVVSCRLQRGHDAYLTTVQLPIRAPETVSSTATWSWADALPTLRGDAPGYWFGVGAAVATPLQSAVALHLETHARDLLPRWDLGLDFVGPVKSHQDVFPRDGYDLMDNLSVTYGRLTATRLFALQDRSGWFGLPSFVAAGGGVGVYHVASHVFDTTNAPVDDTSARSYVVPTVAVGFLWTLGPWQEFRLFVEEGLPTAPRVGIKGYRPGGVDLTADVAVRFR